VTPQQNPKLKKFKSSQLTTERNDTQKIANFRISVNLLIAWTDSRKRFAGFVGKLVANFGTVHNSAFLANLNS
jgi:hypothetical protein